MTILAVGGFLSATPLPAVCQTSNGDQPSRWSVGGGGQIQLLVGSELIDGGIGPFLAVGWHPTSSPLFRLAVAGSLGPLEDDVDERSGMRADNTLWTLVAGPELTVPLWRLEPHFGLVVGLMAGGWTVEGARSARSGGSVTFVGGGEAGIDVRVTGGRHPVHVTTALEVLDGGELDFARVYPREEPGPGSVRTEDVAALAVRIGLRLGL